MATTTEEEKKLHSVTDEEALAREADAAGLTIEELAARRREEGLDLPEEERPVPPTQQPLPGTFETISSAAGGTMPTSSELRIMGARRPIEGQFDKGDIVFVVAEVKIGAVEFVDSSDDWGNVQKTVRAHKGRLLSVRIASE